MVADGGGGYDAEVGSAGRGGCGGQLTRREVEIVYVNEAMLLEE